MTSLTLVLLLTITCVFVRNSYGWSATRQYVELETDTQYNYQSLQEVDVKIRSQATSFKFKIQASNDAHVALLTYDGETGQNMYEIVLGGFSNTRSIIRNSRQGTNRVETFHSPLSSTEFRDFWISWEGGVISVGTGTTVGAGQFMTWTDPAPNEVNYLAVTTGFGSSGSWQFDSDSTLLSGVPIAGVATDNVYQYQSVTTRGVRLTQRGNCIPALVFWL
ncbi:C3 and PZP-like alpha-2-macroglobulin domain-containing protein 8 [Haliotis rufescens]|uniref:C3 and PZP-like alpha-2-macroglobulin domain-containing protein 8 n=1 Tax=Haliotis rufescens TaxID=6454 RepID=UPI00201ECDD0|nr:C3 and PZP-like alpha-2-macroglobulin domain-containing protein 8 [Haliotis rufescens]